MEVLDESQVHLNQNEVAYGGFWTRLGALLVDAVVLAPVTLCVLYFNIISWKSPAILVVLTLVSLAYKPFCEFFYGATLGKMALRLKVVNLQLEKANLQEILLRNIFHIVPSLVSLFLTIDIYNEPEFTEITGFMEYTMFTQQFVVLQSISTVSGLITLVDGIVLLADKQKRSLHDRIGKTYVIERK